MCIFVFFCVAYMRIKRVQSLSVVFDACQPTTTVPLPQDLNCASLILLCRALSLPVNVQQLFIAVTPRLIFSTLEQPSDRSPMPLEKKKFHQSALLLLFPCYFVRSSLLASSDVINFVSEEAGKVKSIWVLLKLLNFWQWVFIRSVLPLNKLSVERDKITIHRWVCGEQIGGEVGV